MPTFQARNDCFATSKTSHVLDVQSVTWKNLHVSTIGWNSLFRPVWCRSKTGRSDWKLRRYGDNPPALACVAARALRGTNRKKKTHSAAERVVRFCGESVRTKARTERLLVILVQALIGHKIWILFSRIWMLTWQKKQGLACSYLIIVFWLLIDHTLSLVTWPSAFDHRNTFQKSRMSSDGRQFRPKGSRWTWWKPKFCAVGHPFLWLTHVFCLKPLRRKNISFWVRAKVSSK